MKYEWIGQAHKERQTETQRGGSRSGVGVNSFLSISVWPRITPFRLKQYSLNIAIKTHSRPPCSKQFPSKQQKAIVRKSTIKQLTSGHVLQVKHVKERTNGAPWKQRAWQTFIKSMWADTVQTFQVCLYHCPLWYCLNVCLSKNDWLAVSSYAVFWLACDCVRGRSWFFVQGRKGVAWCGGLRVKKKRQRSADCFKCNQKRLQG